MVEWPSQVTRVELLLMLSPHFLLHSWILDDAMRPIAGGGKRDSAIAEQN